MNLSSGAASRQSSERGSAIAARSGAWLCPNCLTCVQLAGIMTAFPLREGAENRPCVENISQARRLWGILVTRRQGEGSDGRQAWSREGTIAACGAV